MRAGGKRAGRRLHGRQTDKAKLLSHKEVVFVLVFLLGSVLVRCYGTIKLLYLLVKCTCLAMGTHNIMITYI